MKILSDKAVGGKRRVTIELADGEAMLALRRDAYYELGGQHEDVMSAHILAESREVYWDSLQQVWVPA